MNTEIPVKQASQGWIFYDGACPLCVRSALRAARLLERLGFSLVPLQTPGTSERVGVTDETLLRQMHLLTADGRRFAGADAFVEIARHTRWALPLVTLASLPKVLPLLRRAYDWLATRRHCIRGGCHPPPSRRTERVFLEMP